MNNDTILTLCMAQVDAEALVTRSQAKRLAQRFGHFNRVELDFSGVSAIGQAFADELFRVYAVPHPEIRIMAVNTAPDVESMIRRTVAEGVSCSTGQSAQAARGALEPAQPLLNRTEAANDDVEKEDRS